MRKASRIQWLQMSHHAMTAWLQIIILLLLVQVLVPFTYLSWSVVFPSPGWSESRHNETTVRCFTLVLTVKCLTVDNHILNPRMSNSVPRQVVSNKVPAWAIKSTFRIDGWQPCIRLDCPATSVPHPPKFPATSVLRYYLFCKVQLSYICGLMLPTMHITVSV